MISINFQLLVISFQTSFSKEVFERKKKTYDCKFENTITSNNCFS